MASFYTHSQLLLLQRQKTFSKIILRNNIELTVLARIQIRIICECVDPIVLETFFNIRRNCLVSKLSINISIMSLNTVENKVVEVSIGNTSFKNLVIIHANVGPCDHDNISYRFHMIVIRKNA